MLLSLALSLITVAAAPEPHWSFVPPQRVDATIDSIVQQALKEEELSPSPTADRNTLVRRVFLDLIGLPPSPNEVAEFVEDKHPDAYGELVDQLLASPHFGEKWARWWLDLAGYADSDGYLSDFLRPDAWRYRQWVVDALNDDLPFDQFTIEQLAGDLLPNASTSQYIATGFLRNTLSNREGGADLEEYRVKQVVARTNMVGAIWLGLTVGCAECHDHKFDPISQKEYFQLYAFFNNADEINVDAPTPDEDQRYQSAKKVYDAERLALLAPVAEDLTALQAQWETKLLDAAARAGETGYKWDRAWEVLGLVWGQNFGEGQLEGTLIVKTPLNDRTQDNRDRILDYFLKNGSIVDGEKFSELNLGDISKQLGALAKSLPKRARAPAMTHGTSC